MKKTIYRKYSRGKKKGGQRYHIKFVGDDVLKDYAGMNYYAGKDMGFTPNPKPLEILIDKDLDDKVKKETIKHEIIEADLMKDGMSYWDAHQIALKKERKTRDIAPKVSNNIPKKSYSSKKSVRYREDEPLTKDDKEMARLLEW